MDAVAALIASDLRAALDVPLLPAGPGRQMHFEGSAHEMTFVALVRTGFRSRGLRQVRYRIREAEGRRELLRETVPYRASRSKDEHEKIIEILLKDLGDFSLCWLQESSLSWNQAWEAETQLPTSTRLSLQVVPAPNLETLIDLP